MARFVHGLKGMMPHAVGCRPGAVIAAALLLAGMDARGQAGPPPPPAPIVTLGQGAFRGTVDGGVAAFLGIPYAAAPIGPARWTPPRPVTAHRGVRPAVQPGASCPQPMSDHGDGAFGMWSAEYVTPRAPGISEDCLFANVWTPARVGARGGELRLPVLLFLHGGAYFTGSGAVPIYNGARLAAQGIVVVVINYRLGALGFMAHPALSAAQGGGSGNYGIQDQIEALRWIRDNIASFGGDPARVTVAGQSAGAGSALALMAAPSAKGLFRAAVIQSVPLAGNFKPLAQAEATGVETMKQWGVASIDEARALPVDRLVRPLAGPTVRFLLTADGRTVPTDADTRPLASDVPVMIGYTLNDLFVPNRTVTAAQWQAEARSRYADRAAAFLRYFPGRSDAGATDSAAREQAARVELDGILRWQASTRIARPVYGYLFSHVEPGPDAATYRAFHSSELPYEFDTLDRSPGRRFTATDRAVAAAFSGAIVNFVTSLSPAGGSVPRWPALTADGEAIVEFADRPTVSRIVPRGADEVIAAGRAPSP